jgi:hypothetical protein
MATNLYGYLVTCTSHSVKHRSFFFFSFQGNCQIEVKVDDVGKILEESIVTFFHISGIMAYFLIYCGRCLKSVTGIYHALRLIAFV